MTLSSTVEFDRTYPGDTLTVGGIHHVTAIAADAQRNIDFYTGALGLRLVKVAVNFDDPTSYHFYYGDAAGSPGTIMTFFVWRGAYHGRAGGGQVSTTAFSVPPGSLSFWRERLQVFGITAGEEQARLGEKVMPFLDPDSLPLELIEDTNDRRTGWTVVEEPYAIRGLHSATAEVASLAESSSFLQTLGFRNIGEENGRIRFQAGENLAGGAFDLVQSSQRRGSVGAGQVHHIAWRVPDETAELAFLAALQREDANVSPVMERFYFRSIYFREPGGVLYEIATDSPGFAVDEASDALGQKLMLPPNYESQRAAIEPNLAPLRLASGHTIP